VKPTSISSEINKPPLDGGWAGKWTQTLANPQVKAQLIHYVCLFVICINPLLGFLNFWQSDTLYGIISLVALIALIVNKSGFFVVARVIFITGFNFFIFATAATGANPFWTYLSFAFASLFNLLLFLKKERWHMVWNMAISIMILLIALTSGYSFPDYLPNREDLWDLASIVNIVCTLISVIVAIYYLLTIYEKTEGNLRMLIRQLQAQEKAIHIQNQQLLSLNANLLQSQEDLLRNQVFLNTIIDHLPVMLTVKETKNLKLLRANKAVEELTKYLPEELLNKTNTDIFPQEQADLFTATDRQVLLSGKTSEQEEYLTDKQNKTHVLNTKRVPVYGKSNELLYLLSISEDITQRKRQEQVLNNTLEELKVRNHELDNYTYRVSHDLRSPLCSILGLVGLIKVETDIAVIKEYVNFIEQTVVKSDYFIQSILDHSKMLHAEPVISEINFQKMIEDTYNELKYIVNFEKVNLLVTQKGDKFFNDEFRIATVLRNLLSNALRFADSEKVNKYVKCTMDVNEIQTTIIIEDNGIGIEEKHLPHVFDMFFRGSEKSAGSGLGLYIVKQTVEKLEGNIIVKSKAGVGTQFILTIPNRKSGYFLI
jgi:PAS domain S-box-containing protein